VSDCILWPGYCLPGGYGRTRRMIDGIARSVLTHRLAFVEHHDMHLNQIEGLVVRHSCDNPPCMNPEHLLLGTQADNVQDMMDRGRGYSGGAPRRVSSDTVAQVFKLRDQNWSFQRIGRELGMSHTYARDIYIGKHRKSG